VIRVGIAGIGFMGMIHFLSYQRIRGARVVAICSRNRKRLVGDWQDIRGNFGPQGMQADLEGIRTHDSLDALLRDGAVDLIDITLPPSLHAETTIAAMKRGKHVFSEKPMALKAADCRRMMRAADRAKRQLLVGHVLPFFPEYTWALKLVQSGKYGRLRGGTFRRVVAEPMWLKGYWDPSRTGGPMLDLHVHDAHFIRLLFGMPARVATTGNTHNGLPKFWHSHFGFQELEFVVHATSGTIDQQGRPFCHGFEIQLERATLAFEFALIDGVGQYLCPPTVFDSKGRVTRPTLAGGDPMDAFEAELREAIRCVAQDRPSDRLSGELAMDAIELCHKQAQSLASGRPVRV
jgi:predicted dehydrogenase